MFDWITSIVERMGPIGVALLMFLENVFPPIPSELVMPLAGFVAERGDFPLWRAIIAGSLGSLAGAVGWYLVGRKVGEKRLRRWVDDHGRWLTLSCEDIDKAKDWFDRHGGAAVFIGRLIPVGVGHGMLEGDGSGKRIHGACELDESAVADELDETSTIAGDGGLESVDTVLT